MTSQTWPGTDTEDPRYGRTYIYGAYWEAGLRIFDISDVPHPVNSPFLYAWHTGGCLASGGSQAGCTRRAPEVGHWDDFADLDGDGELRQWPTGNENGGRASYIHYAEPFPEMVDTSHLGGPAGDRHLTVLAVEVLAHQKGLGWYTCSTHNYTMSNGNLRFEPALYSTWEIPTAWEHCYGSSCEVASMEMNGCCSAHTTWTVSTSQPMMPTCLTIASVVLGMVVSMSATIMEACGLSMLKR